MKLLLFLSSSILTLPLVIHAVKVRGARTALAFFTSAFLFGIVRGNSVALLAGGDNSGPYIFSDALISIGRAELPACVGWVFALYLSWTLAESVLRQRPAAGGAVFPLSAFALLAMGCFSDAVETTASGVGWWRWNIVASWTPLLPGGTHLFAIVEWMSVGFDFLVPFLLFRTPRGIRSPLAWASLLLYPVHWACHWRHVTAPGFPHAYEIFHALIVFAVPTFLLLQEPRLASAPEGKVSRGIARFPMVSLAGMFAVLIAVDLLVLESPELLVSLLPLGVLASSEFGGEKTLRLSGIGAALLAFAISIAAGRGAVVAAIRMAPPLVIVASLLVCVALLAGSRRFPVRRIFAGAVVAAMVLAAAGMIRGKRVRERYSRLMERAQTLTRANDYVHAEAVAKQAMGLKPSLNLTTKMLVNIYGGQGRLAEAWEYARRSVDLNPADFEAQRLAGQVLRGQGRVEQAIPYYERALMLNPGDSETAGALADCYSRQRRYADAIKALRRTLARQPEDVTLARVLGALLLQTGDLRGAQAVVADLLRRAPADAGAHVLMAYIQATGGNSAAARAEAEQALRINPEDPQAKALLDSLPK